MPCVTRFQVLRGTTAERVAFIPLIGELVFDTSLSIMFVGDGITYGGNPFSGPDPLSIVVYTSNSSVSGVDYAIADSATPITLTLPDASTYTKKVSFKNKGSGVLTIATLGGQLIDSYTDVQLNQTNAVELIPKNGAWYIW